MISVIVPVYNSEQYLDRCLKSLLKQTYTDFEVLLINDQSTDNSLSIAQKYAKEDNRIDIFDVQHIGFPNAKNLGLNFAKGEYVAFLDSDDFVREDWLQVMYDTAVKTKADLVATTFISFTSEEDLQMQIKRRQGTKHIRIRKDDKQLSLFSRPVCSYMWNKLYRKELFDGIRCPNVISMSDTAVLPSLAYKANYIAVIDEPVYYYYVHFDSMCHSAAKKYGAQYWELRAQFYTNLVVYIYNENNKKWRESYRLYRILQQCAAYIDISKYKEQLKDWWELWEGMNHVAKK